MLPTDRPQAVARVRDASGGCHGAGGEAAERTVVAVRGGHDFRKTCRTDRDSRESPDIGCDTRSGHEPKNAWFSHRAREKLEERVLQIFHHLGDWIGAPMAASVEAEFAAWGRRRFDQGIAVTEIIYSIIVLKHHLRRYIRDKRSRRWGLSSNRER